MKIRILASIITGVSATSAAQAGSVFSTRELDVICSESIRSFARNVDISGYYAASAQRQEA